MIRERVVLFGIENFEQRCRRIAAIIRAQLVDFVEHHHRIVHAGAANRLNDAAGHRAYIGTPMAAQLGFVANAAETDALEMPVHRPRDRPAQRCLPNTGRADKTKDRALRIGTQFSHGQEFQDALFHVLESEVIFVEHFPRFIQIKAIFGRFLPRQFQNEIQISANDVIVGRHAGQFFHAAQFALGFLAHVVG